MTSELTFAARDNDLRAALDEPNSAVLFSCPMVASPLWIPLDQIDDGVVTIPDITNLLVLELAQIALLLDLEGATIRTGPFEPNTDQQFGVGPVQGQIEISNIVTKDLLNNRIRGFNARETFVSANGNTIDIEIEAYPHMMVTSIHVRIYCTIELNRNFWPCSRSPLNAICTNFNAHALSFVDPMTLLAFEAFKPLIRDELTKIAQEEVDKRVPELIEEEGGPPSTVITVDSISGAGSIMEFSGVACAPLDEICNSAFTLSTSLGFRPKKEMSHLRSLRNHFLRRTKKGTYYLEMYDKHKDEIRRLIATDNQLIGEMDNAIAEVIRCFPIEVLHRGSVSKKAISQSISVLQRLTDKASKELTKDIEEVSKDLASYSGMTTKEVLQRLQDGDRDNEKEQNTKRM